MKKKSQRWIVLIIMVAFWAGCNFSFTKYENSVYGFSINSPAFWQKLENPDNVTSFVSLEKEKNGSPVVMLGILPYFLNSNTNFEDEYNVMLNNYSVIGKILDKGEMSLDSHPAKWVLFKNNDGGSVRKIYFTSNNQVFVMIDCAAFSLDYLNKYEKILEKFVLSFKFR